MSLISKVVETVSKLQPAAIELVIELVRGALESDDPERYLRRKLEAEAVHKGAQAAVDEALSPLK